MTEELRELLLEVLEDALELAEGTGRSISAADIREAIDAVKKEKP